MMPVFAKGRELIFFMSFDAVILQKILFEKMISEHQMFLVRKDVPELIEVSTQAVRDKLNRSINLSQEELARVKAINDIPDSRWKIVVLENPDLMSSQQLDTFMDTAVLYVVLLLFWFSVLWLGLHYEVSRGKLLTRLSHLSNHDELTEVANRRKLLSNLEFSIQTARRHGEYAAILYLDLNGFKQINDDFGHDMGDSVLINCANRLRTLTRSGDLVARLGGDEFVVLLNNLGSDVEKAKMIIDRKVAVIRDSLDRPYSYKNITGRCMPSIGVRLITAEDSDVEELLNHADKLMYQDKQKTKQDDA
jgi:diguanylate cyclase (GGDEF)-like protein